MTLSRSGRCGWAAGLLLMAVTLDPRPSLAPSGRAYAQESPTSEPSCAPGELCVPDEIPEPGEAGEGSRRPVNDPPGRYLRSLSTMGLIAVIVGAYFFLALTGKSLRLRR